MVNRRLMVTVQFALLFLLAVGSAVLYSFGLAVDWPEWVHGSNWVWVRRVPEITIWRFVLLGWTLFIGWVGLTWVWHSSALVEGKATNKKTAVLLLFALFLTPLVQLVIASQHRSQPLSVAFLTAVPFMQEGITIEDPVAFIQAHTAQMPHYRNVHIRTQPPGWPLVFWAARSVWQHFPDTAEWLGRWLRRYDCLSYDLQGNTPAQLAAATAQMSILLLSGLGVFPLYGLGKGLFGERVGQTAVLAYPFIPGLSVFQARFDVFYALLALLSLWLAYRYLMSNSLYPLTTLCLLLAGSTFVAFAPLAIAGVVGLFFLVAATIHIKNATQFKTHMIRLLLFTGLFVASLFICWGGFWFLWRASWWQMFQVSREIHQTVRISYPIWWFFNVYDLGVFLGLPWMVLALWAGVKAGIGRFVSPSPWGQLFIMSWLAAVLLLNFSGEVQAETGRLWLFLAPPGLLVGVAALNVLFPASPFAPKSRWPVFPSLFFLVVLLQSLTTGYFLGGRVPASTVPEPTWWLPDTATAVSHQLGDTFTLRGYETVEHPNQLTITLYWQAFSWPPDDYSVFVHLHQNGQIMAQSDGSPMAGALPTWCWVPREVVTDTHLLPWDGKRPYSLLVGLYDWRTGQRLPVSPPTPDQAIILE